jgi:putative ABC transport system permease protein
MSLDPHERRVRDEMEHHLEELQAQLEAEGLDPDVARAEAIRRFGDRDRVARDTPDPEPTGSRLLGVLDAVRQDVAFSLRQMRRSPLTSALTVATLVLGVSAAAVVFAVVHAVVLRPLPFADPERIVHVGQTSPQGRRYSISEPNFVDFRARQRSFEEMAAIGWASPILSGSGEPESVEAMRVSHTLFALIGVRPVLGRDFTAEEDAFGGANEVALLSEGAWTRRFGADPAILGRTVVLDGVAHRVVGVMPSEPAWPGVELFTPLAPNPDVYRDDQRLEAVARLAPGVSIEQAQRDMSRVAAQLSSEYPQSNDGWGAFVRSARDWRIGADLERLGGLLLGAVALFLAMTCASVSNLLLARASARSREMSVRSALGAGRGRILGQLVAEGAALAAVGGGLALLVSFQGLRLAKALGPADVARLNDATVGGPALAVALVAAMLTVLVAGVTPALLLGRRGASAALRASGSSSVGTGGAFRDALVVVQFALAVTVVTGAGLLVRSFMELQQVDLGFETGGVVRFGVRLPDDEYDQGGREDYLRILQDEIQAIPGVRAVGASTVSPFGPMRPSNFVARSDREPDRQDDFVPVSWRAITGDYFSVLGIPVLAGRTFGPQDRFVPGGPPRNPPVIIDRVLAETLWPDGEDPVGRLVTWFLPGGQQCEVVGVVATARDERVDVEPRPRIYRPFTYTSWDQPAVLVRTAGDPGALIPELRRVALQIDPAAPAIDPAPVARDVRETVAWPRFGMQVLSFFGLVALTLAAMGVYGVTAFSVARRRHEIGVRVALGAKPAGVQWMVVRRGIRLAGVGIGLGLALALVLSRFLGVLLYDVSATDPATFLLVPAVLGLVALASTWIPARRALDLDPRAALVSE